MKELDTFIGSEKAAKIIRETGKEFAVVKNPSYIHPSFELYPLADKITEPVTVLKAAVMDMDGTTTTTESLCIHALEFMIRKITNRMSQEVWEGLDRRKDYPHIIGNSTTKHVEYLIDTYEMHINNDALHEAYLYAAIWTLVYGKDPGRVAEVTQNLLNLGCGALLKDESLSEQRISDYKKTEIFDELITRLNDIYLPELNIRSHSDLVRAGIDIYYQRYHEILEKIQLGQGDGLARELLGSADQHLIEPMKGIGIFIALVKGWLGDEIARLIPLLKEQLAEKGMEWDAAGTTGIDEHLIARSRYFEKNPLKVAVVTSSILYEAKIVMAEVFRVLESEVRNWPVSEQRKQKLLEKFSSYQNVYDGFITATDSSEIRLKPHRDLYSIALYQLGIPKEEFKAVMGFEDSESGTIAIRAAGIGLCLAVPFSDTQHHDFRAASHILHGGLPETILKHKVFLNIE